MTEPSFKLTKLHGY